MIIAVYLLQLLNKFGVMWNKSNWRRLSSSRKRWCSKGRLFYYWEL